MAVLAFAVSRERDVSHFERVENWLCVLLGVYAHSFLSLRKCPGSFLPLTNRGNFSSSRKNCQKESGHARDSWFKKDGRSSAMRARRTVTLSELKNQKIEEKMKRAAQMEKDYMENRGFKQTKETEALQARSLRALEVNRLTESSDYKNEGGGDVTYRLLLEICRYLLQFSLQRLLWA